jgi:hypothetical protein
MLDSLTTLKSTVTIAHSSIRVNTIIFFSVCKHANNLFVHTIDSIVYIVLHFYLYLTV